MSTSPLEEIRHSASHVLATAILRVFPDAKLDIGPATESGFYYDIDLEHKLTAEDLTKLEAEMKKVIDENQSFRRSEVSREEAVELIKKSGQERYKLGRLADVPEGEAISFYQNGEFLDLCAGPHVRYTKQIKAFKLLSIAGAYHRGDEKNKQLQRIYGTAFASKEELAQYLERMEQAKQRDHRKLGRDLKLFVIDDDVELERRGDRDRAQRTGRVDRHGDGGWCDGPAVPLAVLVLVPGGRHLDAELCCGPADAERHSEGGRIAHVAQRDRCVDGLEGVG